MIFFFVSYSRVGKSCVHARTYKKKSGHNFYCKCFLPFYNWKCIVHSITTNYNRLLLIFFVVHLIGWCRFEKSHIFFFDEMRNDWQKSNWKRCEIVQNKRSRRPYKHNDYLHVFSTWLLLLFWILCSVCFFLSFYLFFLFFSLSFFISLSVFFLSSLLFFHSMASIVCHREHKVTYSYCSES